MSIVQREVSNLLMKYGTNNPFDISSQKNILIFYEELGDIWGYYNLFVRVPMIHINNELTEFNSRFTCAHELGHYILHPNVNTPFLKKNTLFCVSKIEREANHFATHLLIGNDVPYPDETKAQFLTRNGIPSNMHGFY
ncbi:Zn-dependent peptidase ImmA (M78 family) [Paenibacillus sp. DS2015]|uniref:ImmA/IrrE family metallo-endopeptidase n=1 Tax=Paenibacillus sp. DS2015 TaxID=3373917 RepID=UPI003D233827